MTYPFRVGERYARKDVAQIIGKPESEQKGDWFTGYTTHGQDIFIFCNVGIPGRTGHNYQNRVIGDELDWSGKNGSKLSHKSIQDLIKPKGSIYIFYREGDKQPFIFAGLGSVKAYQDTTPVRLLWSFEKSAPDRPESLPEEIEPETLMEGAAKKVTVNAYERNPLARRLCIEFHGLACAVCDMKMEDKYGEIGCGFIQVHHLVEISTIGQEYEIDPVRDLRPVCPNCHAMLHRRRPAYSIRELQHLMSKA